MKSKSRKILIFILLLSAVLCFSYTAWFLIKQYIKPKQDDRALDSIRDVYDVSEDNSNDEEPVRFEPDINGFIIRSTSETPEDNESDSLRNVKELNDNVIAWIQAEGTTIDYPVVKGEDNSFYLNHDIYGSYTQNGSVFMDYRCDQNSQNVIIYGHHMNADIMFTGLMNYKNKDFVKEHPTIYCDLDDRGSKKWDIIAAFACSSDNAAKFLIPSFDMKTIKEFKNNITDYRYFDTGVDFNSFDQYLTLVTCSYENYNWRTVVIAKRR